MTAVTAASAAKGQPNDILAEAVAVLSEADTPLHYRELTRRIQRRGRWTTSSRTPETVVNVYLAKELRERGDAARFVRIGRGIVGLRAGEPTADAAPPIDVESSTAFLDEESYAPGAIGDDLVSVRYCRSPTRPSRSCCSPVPVSRCITATLPSRPSISG